MRTCALSSSRRDSAWNRGVLSLIFQGCFINCFGAERFHQANNNWYDNGLIFPFASTWQSKVTNSSGSGQRRPLIGWDNEPITAWRYNDATSQEVSGNLMKKRFGVPRRWLSGKQNTFDISVHLCCQNPAERRLKKGGERKKWLRSQTSAQALVKYIDFQIWQAWRCAEWEDLHFHSVDVIMQLMTKPCGSIRYEIWGRDGWMERNTRERLKKEFNQHRKKPQPSSKTKGPNLKSIIFQWKNILKTT